MSITEKLPARRLEMMQPFGLSPVAEGRRLLLFNRLYGPVGVRLYNGLRDGSVSKDELKDYDQVIKNHFYSTLAREHGIPREMAPLHYKLTMMDTKVLLAKVIRDACPSLGRQLGGFKSVLIPDIPDPSILFRMLVLPKNEVDSIALFQVLRHFVVGDTFGRGDRRLRDDILGLTVSRFHERLNRRAFVGAEEAGEPYEFYAYHDDQTNRVTKLARKNGEPKPAASGEHLAKHKLTARRVKGYGLVYADIIVENTWDKTIRVLANAAKGNGVIRPADGKIKMIFVNLEDQPECCKGRFSNRPHLRALKEIVLAAIATDQPISSIPKKDLPDEERQRIAELKSNTVGIYVRGLPVGIELEFLSRQDYLNQKFHVGVISPIKGLPVDVPNGKAETLESERELAMVVPHLFPPKFCEGVDAQKEALETINREAVRLKAECTTG